MTIPSHPTEDVETTGPSEVTTLLSGEVVEILTDAAQSQHRFIGAIFEIDLDWCANTFGVAPCTATGTKCYQGFTTCKDKPNYRKTVKTIRFGLRGMPATAGDTLRPYLTDVSTAPAEIKPGSGLAIRSQSVCTLIDETDNDTELDPYFSTRASPAGGTFWRRFQARHPNVVGRNARLKRGFMSTPLGEMFYKTEHYIVESIAGPDSSGKIKVTLSDPIRFLDRSMVPAATDGKLAAALPVTSFSGGVASSTQTQVTFNPGAPVTDGAWDGYELAVVGNTGSGQRSPISNYDGDTLTATVSLQVPLDTSSQIEVRPLSMNVGTGKGTQYGESGWVRLGDEVIQFTGRTDDVLSWPASSYRAQFGTTASDHDEGAGVQLCRVWQDEPASQVILDLLNEGGIDSHIDQAGIESEDDTWLREPAHITACLSKPEKVGDALGSLAKDLSLLVYWNPSAQLVQAKVNLPQITGAEASYTEDDFIHGSLKVERRDGERLTRAGQFYELRSATADLSENKNYARAEIRIDTDAEGVNEYNDERADVQQSKWLKTANSIHVQALVARRLAAVRDAPHRFSYRLDPREEPSLGDLVDNTSSKLTDTEGQPKTVRCRVVKLSNEGYHWNVEAQSTTFSGRRYAFIAPNGQANFGSATAAEKQYAYICGTNGLMSDSTQPYLVI